MGGLMRAHTEFKPGDLKRNLQTFDEHLNHDIAAVFDLNAAWGTTWMKVNAPWTDDTGAARTGLTATPSRLGSTHELLLAYSVNYGIWLEVANSGRFQILGPAMRVIGDKILSDLEYILNGKPPGSIGAPTQTLARVARKAKPVTNKSGNRRSHKKYGKRRNS